MRSLAWRNIWRRKARTVLVMGSVAMVVIMTLLLFALSEAMRRGLLQNATDKTGHLLVRAQGWQDSLAFDRSLIRDAATLRGELTAVGDITGVVEVLELPALLFGEDRSRGVLLAGVARPPELAERFRNQHLAAGHLPEGDHLGDIALGAALATALAVDLGDTVYAYAPGTEGIGASAFRVVGLLDLPEGAVEARAAYLSLAAAQLLAAPGAATRFEIHLATSGRSTGDRRLALLQQALARQLGRSYAVETWHQAYPDLATLLKLMTPIMGVFAAMFFGMAGLLVMNTVYLSLIERIRELGVMTALGASRRRIIELVMFETVLLVVSGAAVGGVFGALLVGCLHRGFSLPFDLARVYAEFGYPPVLYASVSPGQISLALAFTLITALLSALWPAMMAARIEPVEAMRFVG